MCADMNRYKEMAGEIKNSLKADLGIYLWKISVKWLRCWDSIP